MARGIPLRLVGERFGEWTVLSKAPNDSSGKTRWNCRCSCGAEAVVQTGNLRSRRSQRCRACSYLPRQDRGQGVKRADPAP